MLAAYASNPEHSKGRRIAEDESDYRSAFQRDRDRIIHSSAFRRLKHKTQVFVEHEGDLYRTRLTHSIEAAQVGRTIAGALGLNTDLTEAVALAHDLGHTPFGHGGEDTLNVLMEPFGGFDHNAHGVKIVTRLEKCYARFDGLNLTWETLEALAKHNGPVKDSVPYALQEYEGLEDLDIRTYPSAEAQVASVADDIAYNCHDLQDGLRARLFSDEDIKNLPIIDQAIFDVDARYPDIERSRHRHEVLRRVFGVFVSDVIASSRETFEETRVHAVEDVRDLGHPVVAFSKEMQNQMKNIQEFLFLHMYRAPSVMKKREETSGVMEDLFALYLSDAHLLPERWQKDISAVKSQIELARIVSDYIAGMTDRFALQEHRRLIVGYSR